MLYVIVVLVAVVLLLGLYLWDTKQRINQAETTQKFWYEKWFAEVDNGLEVVQRASFAEGQVVELRLNYQALEQGRDEESEAYEMQFLSFKEILGAQTITIETLQADREILFAAHMDHDRNCLPNVYKSLDVQDAIDDIKERIALEIG